MQKSHKANCIVDTNMDSKSILKALHEIIIMNKDDRDRLTTQEIHYEHLAKAVEDSTISTASAIKELTAKTSELAVAIKEIAINEQHTEKRILKEIDELKEDIAQSRKDHCLSSDKTERHIDNLDKRVKILEIDLATRQGEEKIHGRYRKFWNSNGIKIILLIATSVSVLATIYNSIR